MELKQVKKLGEKNRYIPVIQEIQTESWVEERETEICSGSKPSTVLWTLGSVSGKSMAFPLKLSSSGLVTGLKGPSSVVGIAIAIAPLANNIDVIVNVRTSERILLSSNTFTGNEIDGSDDEAI